MLKHGNQSLVGDFQLITSDMINGFQVKSLIELALVSYLSLYNKIAPREKAEWATKDNHNGQNINNEEMNFKTNTLGKCYETFFLRKLKIGQAS